MTRLKTLLVWLLLLTLPLQGFASASMVMCDTGPAQAQMQQHHAAPASAGDAADAEHCEAPSTSAKCSTCAACSVGAVIVSVFDPLTGFESVGSQPIPYFATHVTANVPGGLERPPHSLIA
jgi:hypothetical protein